MDGTKMRAVACVVLAAFVTCCVVVLSLSPSWGHGDSPTRPAAKKESAPVAAKKEPAGTTVIVSRTTTRTPTVVLGAPENPPEAKDTAAPVKVEPAVSETTKPALVALDSLPPTKEDSSKAADPVAPTDKKELAEGKKDADVSTGIVPLPGEKAQPAKDDKDIKLASGTEPASPAVGPAPVTGIPTNAADPATKPALGEPSAPKTDAKDKPPLPNSVKSVTEPEPVKSTDSTRSPTLVAPVVSEAKPTKPATPDEELEQSRAQEKQLAGELAQKQAQVKELETRHQEARARVIKALSAKVEAVTKEMEKLQKELKDRQQGLERVAPTPKTETDKWEPSKPVVSEPKTEERIKPSPVPDNTGAKEPPPAVEPAQEKAGPSPDATSGKSKTKPKTEDPADPTKPPAF
jgi:hypothetical protein